MKPRVAIVRTHPETVLEDYARLMHLADYGRFLPQDRDIVLKLNLSWNRFFPACSTPPWQLEGVVRTLLRDGYQREKLHPVENKTVVTDPVKGAQQNRWLAVLRRYGLTFTPLPEVEWVRYEFHSDLLVMRKVFPKGIFIPRMLVGKSVLHLPTLKTHGHSITTGAIKNSFGGLLREVRHYCHKHIHETLVDLMMMQKELHPGLFAAADGSIAGDGAGPRTMVPREKNLIMAGGDSVALDAIAARLMGFDPMEIPYLRLCHERGLGVADPEEIEIVGDEEAAGERWGFKSKRSFVIWGDQMLRRGPLRCLEGAALNSPLMAWAPWASTIYHDLLWYPLVGRGRVRRFMDTGWGRLFDSYTM